MTEKNIDTKTAILVTVYQDSYEDAVEHAKELGALAYTFGVEVLDTFVCKVKKFDAATYLGKGRVEEVATRANELKADLIIFDDEITPNQQKNLEKSFARPVIDRTALILEVFAAHAKTREAMLQIELAQTRYQLPRLKRMWTHLSRQRMSGGHLKGEGEKQIEIDRRNLKKRITFLEREINAVRLHRETQRQARLRSHTPSFAIVGYTNAGKSTLLRALTDADILVEDKLFATLDTTSRQFILPNQQKIILIDTVGLIRKLPHNVIAAFRSTLEEVCYADILLHLIDISHSQSFEQAEVTKGVLNELGVDENKPVIRVLNKIDKLEDPNKVYEFRLHYTHTIPLSAKTGEGMDLLLNMMMESLKALRKFVKVSIPQSEYHLVSELMEIGHVSSKEYEGNHVIMEVEIPVELEYKVRSFLVDSP